MLKDLVARSVVIQQSSEIRREEHDGREWLIAPVVALKQGVLNGSLVMAEEFGRYPDAWAGIPLVLSHPKRNGVPVSANAPEWDAERTIGRFWKPRIENDKLVGEAWIDLAKVERLGPKAQSVVAALEAGEHFDVSTGYFADEEAKRGMWNGAAYDVIVHNLRPDHLAVLPTEMGACSWNDGCGVPRLHEEESEDEPEERVMDKTEAVSALSRFLQAIGLNVNEEALQMNKADVIKRLVANERCPLKAEALEKLELEELKSLEEGFAEPEQEEEEVQKPVKPEERQSEEEENEEPKAHEEDDAEKVPAWAKALTEQVGTLSEQVQAVTSRVTAEDDARKDELVEALSANESVEFTEAELKALDLNVLEKMARSIAPKSFVGRPFPQGYSTLEDNEVPEPPKVLLAEPNGKKSE